MPRARNIKPGFFTNDSLGELSPLARLAFIGLWGQADFNGNLHYKPKRLKVEILPYDTVDFAELVAELEAAGFVRRYRVADAEYLHLPTFTKHQRPHKNEVLRGTDVPKPDQAGTERDQYGPETEPDHTRPHPDTKPARSETVSGPDENRSNPPDTGYLIPDPGYRIADTLDAAADAPASDAPPPSPAKPKARSKVATLPKVNGKFQYPEWFDRLWAKYPNRPQGDDKKAAYQACHARLTEGETQAVIEAGLDRYAAYLLATGKLDSPYILQGSTFFGPSGKYKQPWGTGTNGSPVQSVEDHNRAAAERWLAGDSQPVEAGRVYDHG